MWKTRMTKNSMCHKIIRTIIDYLYRSIWTAVTRRALCDTAMFSFHRQDVHVCHRVHSRDQKLTNVGTTLNQRLRRWSNVEPAFVSCTNHVMMTTSARGEWEIDVKLKSWVRCTSDIKPCLIQFYSMTPDQHQANIGSTSIVAWLWCILGNLLQMLSDTADAIYWLNTVKKINNMNVVNVWNLAWVAVELRCHLSDLIIAIKITHHRSKTTRDNPLTQKAGSWVIKTNIPWIKNNIHWNS